MTDVHDTLTVSVREVRVVVERCLMLLGVPRGALTHVRELVLDAEVLGAHGLRALDEALRADDTWAPPPAPLETDGVLQVDAGGASAMFLATPLAALALAADADGMRVEIRGLRVAHLLEALTATSQRVFERSVGAVPVPASGESATSWRLEVAATGSATPISSDPVVQAAGSAELAAAIRDGISTSTTLWWRLFHRSNDALTEDTPLSRAHAGAMPTDVADATGVASPDLDADYVMPAPGSVLTKTPTRVAPDLKETP